MPPHRTHSKVVAHMVLGAGGPRPTRSVLSSSDYRLRRRCPNNYESSSCYSSGPVRDSAVAPGTYCRRATALKYLILSSCLMYSVELDGYPVLDGD